MNREARDTHVAWEGKGKTEGGWPGVRSRRRFLLCEKAVPGWLCSSGWVHWTRTGVTGVRDGSFGRDWRGEMSLSVGSEDSGGKLQPPPLRSGALPHRASAHHPFGPGTGRRGT